jgi:hypothetical protein
VKCINPITADGSLESSCAEQRDPLIYRNPTTSTNSSNHSHHTLYLILPVNLCNWAYTGRRYETTPCLCEAGVCCWTLDSLSGRRSCWLVARSDSVPNNFLFPVSLFVWAVVLALPAAALFFACQGAFCSGSSR